MNTDWEYVLGKGNTFCLKKEFESCLNLNIPFSCEFERAIAQAWEYMFLTSEASDSC